MEHSQNPTQPKSNTITVEELAAKKFPILPKDCALIRKKKLWQREQFIASFKHD